MQTDFEMHPSPNKKKKIEWGLTYQKKGISLDLENKELGKDILFYFILFKRIIYLEKKKEREKGNHKNLIAGLNKTHTSNEGWNIVQRI